MNEAFPAPVPEPVRLRTGHTVWVRPIEVGDAVELQRAFALLSDLSRYQRFLTGTPALSDQQAAFFSDVDHVDHEALVALPTEQATDIVAVARYVRYQAVPSEADLAITVADRWHRRGLGTALLDLLSERARTAGIQRFTVDMLADNDAIRALVRASGGAGESADSGTVNAHIALEPVAVALSREDLLRAVAGQPVVPVPQRLASASADLRPGARAIVTLS